jgi:hypothetical protein
MTEPQLIVLGPRKRKETSRVTENADPLLRNKKARLATTKSNLALQRHPSVEIQDDNSDDNANTVQQASSEHTKAANKPNDNESESDNDLAPSSCPAPDLTDVDGEDEEDKLEESAEDELRESIIKAISSFLTAENTERLMIQWNTPIYAFFKPTPIIDRIDGRSAHIFECSAKSCKGRNGRYVRRYLNTGDATSTSNLRRHAKHCWGEETVTAAVNTHDIWGARAVLEKSIPKDGSITAAFERIGKEKLTFSHRQHTKTESR